MRADLRSVGCTSRPKGELASGKQRGESQKKKKQDEKFVNDQMSG